MKLTSPDEAIALSADKKQLTQDYERQEALVEKLMLELNEQNDEIERLKSMLKPNGNG